MNSKDQLAAVEYLQRTSVEVQEFGGLNVGDRVKHINEMWPEAHVKGTGVIERIFHKPDSGWERIYGRPDVELVVKRDDQEGEGAYRFLADYHVQVVTP